MSRIGKHPISIPAGVTVSVKDGVVTVKGPKGELTQSVDARIEVAVEDAQVVVRRGSDDRQERSLHGLYRALINNMIVGVSEGFTKTLELVGVGYRASNQGQILELSLGFTHNIFLQLPKEINLETKTERNKNPLIISLLLTSSCWVRCALRSAPSVCQSLIRVRVFASKVRSSAVSRVSQLVSNRLKHV